MECNPKFYGFGKVENEEQKSGILVPHRKMRKKNWFLCPYITRPSVNPRCAWDREHTHASPLGPERNIL